MKRFFIFFSLSVFLLASCSEDEDDIQYVEPKSLIGTISTNVVDYDALGGIVFENVNQYNNKPYGTLIVDKLNGYPVFDGNKSTRFEVRDGDCGWSDNFSDCDTDRSRSEIFEKNTSSKIGKTITYTESVFIPKQPNFRPKGNDNLLVLSQINHSDTNNVFGALTYLVMENNNELLIRTHKDFTWNKNKDYTITKSPYNKWITIRYEIKVSDGDDGKLSVYVDDKLLFVENRSTIVTRSGIVFMKFGIYNAFRSSAKEDYSTQIAYFDGIIKKVL